MPDGTKLKKGLRDLVIIVAATLILGCFLEGLASFVLFYTRIDSIRIPAERLHTAFDPLLGWVNKRNVHIQDMYGPDIYVKTNSQGFRNIRDVTQNVPAGKRRWICCGDSFTFGYGVDNEHTWCALLAAGDPAIETVNMGQGGYGLDQIYLWYMRDGAPLQHDVLIIAFITEDIPRMASNEYMKYPRPRLVVKNGRIHKDNAPLPRPGFLTSYLPRYYPLITRLSVVRLAQEMQKRYGDEDIGDEARYSQQELIELTLAIFTAFSKHAEKHDRAVFFVHLPIADDYRESPQLDRVRAFLRSSAGQNNWHYIDLIAELRKLGPTEAAGLFIPKDVKHYAYSRGHYSKQGNQYIAGLLAERINRHLSSQHTRLPAGSDTHENRSPSEK